MVDFYFAAKCIKDKKHTPPLVLLNGTRNTAYSLHFKFNLDICRQLVITAFNLIYRHDNQKHLINHSFEKVSNRGEHANAKKVSWVMAVLFVLVVVYRILL